MSGDGDSHDGGTLGRIVAACDRYETEWRAGGSPKIETFLDEFALADRDALFRELIVIDIELRRARDELPALADYLDRFPDRAGAIEWAFRNDTTVRTSIEGVTALGYSFDEGRPSNEETQQAPPLPERLGRYIPTAILGVGGFATVYLARDNELNRQVAIKVPHPEVVASRGRRESLLTEARLAAGLRHPAIVRVLDISPPGDEALFVVLEYVSGRTLAQVLLAEKLTARRLVEILACVCEAVHYAHTAGLVHRDLKPSNILIDGQGQPFVNDFGLAIHEDIQHLWSGEIAGTPRFMAPEQVRGETHRLDGRTDVWALGVILYLGLAGRMPFQSRTRETLFDEILNRDPKPARQVSDEIPRELERICLKCLAKRMTDRYPTASDLADDLQLWLTQAATTATVTPRTQATGQGRDAPEMRVVPKGLRAFEFEDADFFLSLLPGPRDRDGLPESIRSWKTRIEATDPERALPVGLVYGASGCGKSSLVKAGLLPRLAPHVKPVYVEATSDGIEVRLLAALRRRFPYLPSNHGLAETAALLREGIPELKDAKVLIVLDQFEQWLHEHHSDSSSELVQAIRQCDGRRLQALVLVRDDFWMGITRFLRAVEVPLVEGVNSAAVELFDAEHARRVLVELGRAHGRLAVEPPAIGSDATHFLDRVVAELATPAGRVIPVRLSLFAEMVKHRPWTRATLKDLGGIEGIGVTFLEETFAAPSAPPAHRAHRRAALAVLEALLPEPSSDLKGKLQPSRMLQQAAGYVGRDQEFSELMGILDQQLRMVTPVDVEGLVADGREPPGTPREPHYQLTHDYLVPPLRQWLTRKLGETHRGRARLCLVERTALWTNKPESKQLPSWLEWVSILLVTRRLSWTAQQARMMRAASRHHLIRSALALGLCAIVAAGVLLAGRRLHVRSVEQEIRELSSSDWRYLRGLLDRMEPDVSIWRAELERIARDQGETLDARTRAALALSRQSPEFVDFLTERLLEADSPERSVLRDELSRFRNRMVPRLWQVASDETKPGTQRLSAASALASFDPRSDGWDRVAPSLVRELINQDLLRAGDWVQSLRPVRMHLKQPLLDRFADQPATDAQIAAASLLAEYGANDTEFMPDELLAQVVEDASATQYARLVTLASKRRAGLVDRMLECVGEPVPLTSHPEDERQVDREANAAETLLVFDHPEEFWPRLKQTADPRLRTRLIDHLKAPRLSARAVLDRFDQEKDGSIRQAILIGLGSAFSNLPPEERALFAQRMLFEYERDPDPGVHGAAEWVLRKWGFEQAILDVKKRLAGKPRDGKGWFITPKLHTMIVVPVPGEFSIGSPDHEPGRDKSEGRHDVSIDYSFAISAHEVTLAQYREFHGDEEFEPELSPSDQCPKNFVSWSIGALYCNWLTTEVGMRDDERCYPPAERVGTALRAPDDLVRRPGFRLPTDHEWEYAARAGAVTSRFFGNAELDLPKYAWFSLNSEGRTWPVGLLRPNPLGLFDLYGNVDEWCEFARSGGGSDAGPLRGGGFRATGKFLRSAMPGRELRTTHYSYLGFRIAMTLPKP
jgi:eukaryotic-like serine/threonine-protein kinase